MLENLNENNIWEKRFSVGIAIETTLSDFEGMLENYGRYIDNFYCSLPLGDKFHGRTHVANQFKNPENIQKFWEIAKMINKSDVGFEIVFNTDKLIEEDFYMECLMRNVIRYSLVLKKSPMDYEARANLCWIASWALNGFLENGTGRTPICHAIEYEVSGYYDIPHSFGMAVIVPKWLRHIICNETIDAICRFGSEVFGLDISVDSNGALATVKYFETYLYEQMELQKTFSCFSNDIETTISEMAYHICGKCELTGIKNIRSHDIISILRECCMKTSEG